MAWFITLGCEQQSVSLLALFIKNQGVIEKLEQTRSESLKIETVNLSGLAQRHILVRVLLCVLDYPFPVSCKFCSGFSCGKTAYIQ